MHLRWVVWSVLKAQKIKTDHYSERVINEAINSGDWSAAFFRPSDRYISAAGLLFIITGMTQPGLYPKGITVHFKNYSISYKSKLTLSIIAFRARRILWSWELVLERLTTCSNTELINPTPIIGTWADLKQSTFWIALSNNKATAIIVYYNQYTFLEILSSH